MGVNIKLTNSAWKCAAGFTAFALIVALIIPALQAPESIRRVDKIESLAAPAAVMGWSDDGLSLSDGRRLALPGVTKLPSTSRALTRATENGIEITPDGRVIGLVRVHHWCGNDPVRNHLARVDVAHMLMFLRQVDFEDDHVGFNGQIDHLLATRNRSDVASFSEWGWRAGEYYQFKTWSQIATERGI